MYKKIITFNYTIIIFLQGDRCQKIIRLLNIILLYKSDSCERISCLPRVEKNYWLAKIDCNVCIRKINNCQKYSIITFICLVQKMTAIKK